MKALITGASSGIGREIAFYLADLGYDLYLVARNKEKLDEIFKGFKVKVVTFGLDLTQDDNCYFLYNRLRKEKIDILVNNAAFGECGKFVETDLTKELNMLALNVRTYHILMKLFLSDFVRRDYGRVLNVASMAGFMPGPYMATYYATKSYIVKLSLAVSEELKRSKSKVRLSIFCPGPVKTDFDNVANVKFNINYISAAEAGRVAVEGMFKNKLVIIPNNMKVNYFLNKVSPIKLVLKINSLVQSRVER